MKAACQYIRIKRLLVIHNNKRKSITDTWLFVKKKIEIDRTVFEKSPGFQIMRL